MQYRYWDLDSGRTRYGMLRSTETGTGTPPRQSPTYDYEPNGNVHSIADGRTNETTEFTYDALDRLTAASAPISETYSYSEIGNRTKGGESRTYPTSPAIRPRAPTAVASSSYTLSRRKLRGRG